MFEGFFKSVTYVLNFFYELTHSFGASIILLTLVVMVLTAPLTLKSTRSMLQMQRHQPELKRIQTEFKDDRERLNQEVMSFYRDNGINPMSGCFPMLIQAPIFLILYQVIRGITERSVGTASGVGRVVGTVLTPGTSFTPLIPREQVFEPRHLDSTAELYRALSGRNTMPFLGVDLAISPMDALRVGIATFIPALILIGMMLVSQVYQQRQLQGRQDNSQVNPQQQMIMKLLPYTLPIFSFQFPIGLSLYYFIQGLCRIGLQGYITHKVYKPHAEEMNSRKESPPATNEKKTATPAASKKASNSTPSSAKSQATKAKKSQPSTSSTTGRKSGAPRQSSTKR